MYNNGIEFRNGRKLCKLYFVLNYFLVEKCISAERLTAWKIIEKNIF